MFDFCNYPKDSKFYDSQNEMIVGKMKIAYKGIQINKFVGLKSKIHSMLSDDGKESNTAKRINAAIVFNKFKVCVRYFLTNFIYHQVRALQQLGWMVFISLKSPFRSPDI